jgi:hypothetical protein
LIGVTWRVTGFSFAPAAIPLQPHPLVTRQDAEHVLRL